jgi:signal peptidase II
MMATARTRPLAPWLGIAAAVIAIDQLTKAAIVAALQLGDAHRITPFFDIVRAHNRGAAFSFLNDASGWQRWFFVGLGLVAAVFIVSLLARQSGDRLFRWALSLILGGAIGNVIDRLVHGHVIDFVQVHWNAHYFPSFNAADSAITIGAVLLVLDELLRLRRGR